MNCCLICHVCYNRHLSRCLLPLFIISLWIFVKPLITSCQIRHRRKICHCPKNRQLSTCPFLSSHLNIWPNPWWMFGTLTIFVEICLLSIFPSLSPHLRFYQIVGGFLLNSPFSQICHFCENRQLSIGPFCCLIVSILAKFAGAFRKICHFRKAHHYRHASFVILF